MSVEGVAGDGDDVGEEAVLEAAAVVDVDELGGDRRWRRGCACSGVMPRSTRATSSLALRPWGMAGASVPQAILTPRAMALLIVWPGPGGRPRPPWPAAPGAAWEMSMPSAR